MRIPSDQPRHPGVHCLTDHDYPLTRRGLDFAVLRPRAGLRVSEVAARLPARALISTAGKLKFGIASDTLDSRRDLTQAYIPQQANPLM